MAAQESILRAKVDNLSKYARRGLDESKYRPRVLDESKYKPHTLDPTKYEKRTLDESKYAPRTLDPSKYKTKAPKQVVKSQVEKIAEIISDPTATVTTKVANVISTLKIDEETKESVLTRAYAAIWSNKKPLIFTVVSTTLITIAIALFKIYAGGGSWTDLLSGLFNAGVRYVPGALASVFARAGITLAPKMTINALFALAEKDARISKILNINLKPQFVEGLLNRMGMDINKYDLSVKNLTRQAMSNAVTGGISLYTGGMASYLTSIAINQTVHVAGVAAGAGISKAKDLTTRASAAITEAVTDLNKVPDIVADEIFSGPVIETLAMESPKRKTVLTTAVPETDSLQITQIAEKKVMVSPKQEKLAKEIVNRVETKEEQASWVPKMISENKIMIMSTLAAISTVTIALSQPSAASVASLFETVASTLSNGAATAAPILDKSLDFLNEHALAKTALYGIIVNKIGISTLVNTFSDQFADQPQKIMRLRKLEKEKPPGYMDEFLAIIMGEKIYSATDLNRMKSNRRWIKDIAISKNINFSSGTRTEDLIDAILQDQRFRLDNITKMVASALFTAAASAAVTTALDVGVKNLRFSDLTASQVDAQIVNADAEIASEPSLSVQDQLAADLEAEVEYQKLLEVADAEVKAEVEFKIRMDGLAAENAKTVADSDAARELVRETRREEAAFQNRMEDIQAQNAKLRAEGEAIQQRGREAFAKIKEMRALEVERKTLTEPEKAIVNDEARMLRFAKVMARKQLEQAAKLQELTKDIGVVITNPQTGESYPVPANDLLLDPRLQKILSEIQFTPLAEYLAQQTLKSTTTWIPGIGQMEAVINSVNWSLDIAEKTKDVYKVINVAMEITSETGKSAIDIGAGNIAALDSLLKLRLPSLGKAIENMVRLGKDDMRNVVLGALRDKFVYGWTDAQVSLEIGKRVMGGSQLGGLAESTATQIGTMIWGALGK